MNDCWRMLLGCDGFWGACIERSFRLRTLLLLSGTCRAFREEISVAMVVRLAYRGSGDMLVTKVDACQLLGLTTHMLRAHPTPVSFLTAFELAWARQCRQQQRSEKVARKWAAVRAQIQSRWQAEFKAVQCRVRRVEVDALLAAEEAPALEGSRFARLVWLTHAKRGVPASREYLGECADGYARFEWARAASTAQDDEGLRAENLARLDRLVIDRHHQGDRETRLVRYLERNGCCTRGAYFQNCLLGITRLQMSRMRLYFVLHNVPWLTALYADLARKDSARWARMSLAWRLGALKMRFDSRNQMERTMERLADMTELLMWSN